MLTPLVIIAALAVIVMSRPPIAKALLGLVKDREELLLFALFVIVEVCLAATVLALFGPAVGGFVVITTVLLFALWAMRPPAQRR